ncbi:TlpA disulfide reductase family protein [Cytobacillus sp. S13-E01]|uniref:TlpA family protein disulfide reductase n=1 Tax=Cytobacillus sp. S13-E01 TaxID=3031326 RepID=UPI0023D82E08|nr:TlpA disulfide reductase family protein [Cytobacillus sp. S13-E01]MDF0728027.1 TlpA disulfide reductase family protein [Cytobacillus sp. S13-E01]
MMKWKRVLLLVIGVFIGIVITQQFLGSELKTNNRKPAAELTEDPTEVGPFIGALAPDFSLVGLDGKTYALSDLKGDKPVLVNFWASWCPPCKAEAPDLVQLYEEYGDQMEIYAVNLTTSDTVKGAQEFVDDYGFEFPVLLDEKGEVGKVYQALSIPTSYFVDRNGIIQNKMIGITSPDKLEKMFQELINKK